MELLSFVPCLKFILSTLFFALLLLYYLLLLFCFSKTAGESVILQHGRWLKDYDQWLWLIENRRIWSYGDSMWYSWICR